jgi:hypothetical protein
MRMILGLILAAAAALPVMAQPATEAARPGTAVTPFPPGVRALRGQTAEQAQLDVAQCRNVATETTGFVPGANAPLPQAEVGAPVVGGAVRGALLGAGAGAIIGDTGTGAAVGAMSGGSRQIQNRRQRSQQQQQAAATQAKLSTAWTNANVGCLQSRGYAVEKPPVGNF